jgi:hypothetical protein
MALRIKTKYRAKGPKTLEDRSSVVAANIWKIGQETLRRMEIEGYALGQDRQVNAMLTEFMAFLVQIADRLVYGRLNEEERFRFVNALGKNLARIVQDNMTEFVGEGDYARPFIERLNARFGDYAGFEFHGTEPSYTFVRYLGDKMVDAMTETDAKWVKERVIDIEAPEAIKHIKRVVQQVLGIKYD